MATTVGNLPVKGAIKQGGLIGTIDFGIGSNQAPSIWSFALVVQSGVPYLFAKHSSDAVADNWRPADTTLTTFSDAELGVLKDIVRLASKPPATYVSNGIVYVSTTNDVYYTDGAGNFRSTPYTDASTTDQIKKVLADVAGSTDTNQPTVKKWYQKPVTWILTALGTVATIGAIIYFKKKG